MVFAPYKSGVPDMIELQHRPGTNAEAFVVGEILTLSSGKLTKAAVDSDGVQRFYCMKATTGDGSTLIPVYEIKKTMKFQVSSSGQIAATAIGNKYTLSAAATGITTTTTKGIFRVDETDGATVSTVVGHFTSADVL